MTSRRAALAPRAKPAAAMAEHAEQAAALLRNLANPNRLMVLCHLLAEEMPVGQLLEELPLSQSALSQHLAVLREAGLVSTRRAAQQVFYSVADGPALAVLGVLQQHFCRPRPIRRRKPTTATLRSAS